MIKLFFLLFITLNVLALEQTLVVKKGDNLGKIFQKSGLSQSLLINLLNSNPNTKRLNNLKIGKKLVIKTINKKFKSIEYFYSSKYRLKTTLSNYKFNTKFIKNPQKVGKNNNQKYRFKITKSIYFDGKKAGIGFSNIKKIIKSLKGKVDTSRLFNGDVFTVYFHKNKLIFVNFFSKFGRKNISVFRWKNSFYDKNGKSSYKMFLEKPLNYKRISSGFTYNRYHPILKTNRPHRAIDYAANKGVRVFATTSGVIKFKGYKGALGYMVEIKHQYGYSTVYAHLSRFAKNLYKGKRIKKGSVIGFVGSTGRSTGNHLHYELKNNKKYFNPLTHNPLLSFKLKGLELQKFKKHIKGFL